VVNVTCFYVNANAHCSNRPEQICRTNDDCVLGGICIAGWIETDFAFQLTPRQPVAWKLSQGLAFFPLDGIEKVGPGGAFNEDSAVPPAPEDPFFGELKCFQVGDDGAPIDRNDLKGEATIVTANDVLLDARAYNAVGIQAIEGANNNDKTLNIGEEYNDCPNILILDHFFDDAVEPINDNIVRSDLTLVPCSQDLAFQATFNITVQFLVFNEFEQRFSTSRTARCKQNLPLSLLDTTQRERSIFSAGVAGTLTGQTRATAIGSGMLAVADEFHTTVDGVQYSADFNVHFQGDREEPDLIILP
jgi:hypothetical protein